MRVEYTHRWFRDNAKHFDKWFNPEKFNWEWPEYLAIYCSDRFDKWFDTEKFNWDWSEYLAQYLAKYCIKNIDKWYDPKWFKVSKEELMLEAIK